MLLIFMNNIPVAARFHSDKTLANPWPCPGLRAKFGASRPSVYKNPGCLRLPAPLFPCQILPKTAQRGGGGRRFAWITCKLE